MPYLVLFVLQKGFQSNSNDSDHVLHGVTRGVQKSDDEEVLVEEDIKMITRPSVMEVSPKTFRLSKSILLIDHRIPGDHRIAGDHRIPGDHRIAGIIE